MPNQILHAVLQSHVLYHRDLLRGLLDAHFVPDADPSLDSYFVLGEDPVNLLCDKLVNY